MLFKVRYCGEEYIVYSVKQNDKAMFCQFLIYCRGWIWVYADACTPIEQ